MIHILPERWAEELSQRLADGEWKRWASLAGGAWLLLRLAELRQLRRMHRDLLAARA